MEIKRIIVMVLACLLGVALVCVVLVGMINGTWPWSSPVNGDYTGINTNEATTTGGTEDMTQASDDTTAGTQDTAAATQDATAETTAPTTGNAGSGNSGNNNPENVGNSGTGNSGTGNAGTGNSGNSGTGSSSGSSGGNSGSTGNKPAKPTLGVEIEEATTAPTENRNVIDFQELLDKKNNGN